MSYQDDIMYWYKHCGHEIILSQNNRKEEIIGIAICKDTDKTFRITGKSQVDVLNDLKDMLNGVYYK